MYYKAIKACEKLITKQGGEIVCDGTADTEMEIGDYFDIVFKDEGGVLVFAKVNYDYGEDFNEPKINRADAERAAVKFISGIEDLPDCSFRFDTFSLLLVGNNRALLKHHINALEHDDESDTCETEAGQE